VAERQSRSSSGRVDVHQSHLVRQTRRDCVDCVHAMVRRLHTLGFTESARCAHACEGILEWRSPKAPRCVRMEDKEGHFILRQHMSGAQIESVQGETACVSKICPSTKFSEKVFVGLIERPDKYLRLYIPCRCLLMQPFSSKNHAAGLVAFLENIAHKPKRLVL